MAKKPIRGKWGYLNGTCDRCGETHLPLVRVGNEKVCDTCARTMERVEQAQKMNKKCDRDKEFLDRAING